MCDREGTIRSVNLALPSGYIDETCTVSCPNSNRSFELYGTLHLDSSYELFRTVHIADNATSSESDILGILGKFAWRSVAQPLMWMWVILSLSSCVIISVMAWFAARFLVRMPATTAAAIVMLVLTAADASTTTTVDSPVPLHVRLVFAPTTNVSDHHCGFVIFPRSLSRSSNAGTSLAAYRANQEVPLGQIQAIVPYPELASTVARKRSRFQAISQQRSTLPEPTRSPIETVQGGSWPPENCCRSSANGIKPLNLWFNGCTIMLLICDQEKEAAAYGKGRGQCYPFRAGEDERSLAGRKGIRPSPEGHGRWPDRFCNRVRRTRALQADQPDQPRPKYVQHGQVNALGRLYIRPQLPHVHNTASTAQAVHATAQSAW